MKELRQGLSEVINAKKTSELRVINERFLRDVEETPHVIIHSFDAEDEVVVPYVHDDMKRRAQTIATAYRIAFQIYVAYAFARQDLLTKQMEKMDYTSNPGYLDERYGEAEYTNIVSTHGAAMALLLQLAMDEDGYFLAQDTTEELLTIVSSIAVTFAWVETYYKTTFFPKETDIMEVDHPIHLKLVDEVKALLKGSATLINVINTFSNQGKELDFGITVGSEDYGIDGTISILAGTKLFELKTTGSVPTEAKLRQDAKHIVALETILQNPNDTNEPIVEVTSHMLFYTRFNSLVAVDFTLEYEVLYG